MENTDLTLKEAFDKLPSGVKRAILSSNLEQSLQNIAREEALHIDQTSALENETTLLLVGLVEAKDYVLNLIEALEITGEQAQSIAKKVNEEILEPIRRSMLEEDDSVSREDILREIESPSPTKPITSTYKEGPSLIERHNDKVLGSIPIVIPKQTEASLPSPIDLSHELPAHTSDNIPRTIPDSIPTIPIMQKTTPPPLNLPSESVAKPSTPSAPISQSQRTISEIRIPKKPVGIDPYREPVE